ncbi:MAG: serine hydrolase [Gammaproteobacteria bacterium]|nr:serine hydrolase [Gammaproteobacteria bacterium]
MLRLIPAVLAAALSLQFARAADLPETPAGQRLGELIGLIEQATPRAVADYIDEHYTEAYAARLPLAARIDSFMDWKARGGMALLEIRRSEAHGIETVTRQPLSDERWLFSVSVEAEAPHRIEAIRVGRAPLPVLEAPADDEATARAFIDYVAGLAGHGLFSGAVLIGRDGEVLGKGAWGLANRDFDTRNTPDTRFNLGSMNKTWTAVAIGQLVEAGKLAFDDPVSKYIDYPDAESARRIRIEHLLTHTSGLGNYFTDEFDATARKNLRSIDDFLALSRDQALAFEPGEDWRYSNTGMMLAGKIIELASGQDYDSYVAEHIFAPAGMTRSGCFELDTVNDNLAVGYVEDWSVDGMTIRNNLFEHVVKGGPAGGCYSTVEDLFRFARALETGELVGPAMAETLTTGKPELNSAHYGFGFQVQHGGALYGHGGGFPGISANLDIAAEPDGWVVVVLANDDSARAPVVKARQLLGLAEAP